MMTPDGRAELVGTDTSRVIAVCRGLLLCEICTAFSTQHFARQFTVDVAGETQRFLTLEEARAVFDAAREAGR